ncbi:MAG TPA: ABC transporter substrate-binding protein [Chloroflexota bacterium]|nr:ABC transporter substrate-binding protein [Chloroflexota bacterium]
MRRWMALSAAIVCLVGIAAACAPPGAPAGSSGAPAPSTASPSSPAPATPSGAALPGLPPIDTARVDAIRVAWTAASGAQAPVWIAYEGGYFRRYGLDVELTFIASSTAAVQALLADELQFATCAGGAVVASRVGGGDTKIVAGAVNVPAFYLMAHPSIRSVDDLRGRRIAIDRRGASQEVAARLVLRARGLDPDRDVLWISVGGGFLEILASLDSGAADAGNFSSPTNLEARKRGYVELVDIAAQGIPYQGSCIMARESFLNARPEVARKFIRAYVDALHRYKTDEDFSIRVLTQYTKIEDPEIQRATWQYYAREVMPEIPYATLPGIQTVIEEVAATNPRAASYPPEEFVDDRFVRELEAAGYFDQLYGRRP